MKVSELMSLLAADLIKYGDNDVEFSVSVVHLQNHGKPYRALQSFRDARVRYSERAQEIILEKPR